jgi:hypothetical protein
LLAYARSGDTLAVVRLDRLGCSLGKLLAMVAMLKERHRLLSLGGKDHRGFRTLDLKEGRRRYSTNWHELPVMTASPRLGI